MIQPKISVLIPVFNREKFIENTINSVIKQTYENIEIIVFDNASTDESYRKCAEIAKLDKRILLYKNDHNVGPVKNWINCVNEAKGEFSKILFSDDILDPNCLDHMIKILNNDISLGFVCCAANIGKNFKSYRTSYNSYEGEVGVLKYIEMLRLHLIPTSPSAMLFRTNDLKDSILESVPSSTQRNYLLHGSGIDVMISLKILEKYQKIYCIKSALVFFSVHNDSLTISDKTNEIIDSHTSAVSYWVKNILGHNAWIEYLAQRWVERCIKHRKWCNPNKFVDIYEGESKISDSLILILKSFPIILNKFIKKCIK